MATSSVPQPPPATSAVAGDLPPSLYRDRAFCGMTLTQLLGAFNDNLFKQLVLLLCIDFALKTGEGPGQIQGIAQGLFALPFVLFSGFAGWVSDRTSKRKVVVLSKVAEAAVMVAGLLAFAAGGLWGLLAVLFLMGTQSAFFGPAKYGILPEMLHEDDLPQANGLIQMTTFAAIIFGTAAAGWLKELYPDALWRISLACVGIAVLGTLTSLLVRRTPVAHPNLSFQLSSLAVNRSTARMLLEDRPLLRVLAVSSVFWFVGGLVLPAVNEFGKVQMGLGDGRTSLLATCMGVGIAAGCLVAGRLSRATVRFGLVRVGAWGMVGALCLLTALGLTTTTTVPESSATAAVEPLVQMLLPATPAELTARLLLTLLGLCAGLFVVPLQVFMQSRPPADQKGRMIGAMNLVNWVGILLSAGFYAACGLVLAGLSLPMCWLFSVTGALLLPLAVWFRPADEPLRST